MTLTDIFDRTYVLNLAYRSDRRREMGRVLRRVGMDWEPGKIELFEATRAQTAEPFTNLGAHGCFLSHLRMLRSARELGVSRLLIMEDDLEISPRYPELADMMTRRLAEDDWGFAYLGNDGPTRLAKGETAGMARVANTSAKNQFYAIHGQILDPLIGYLELVLSREPGHPDGGPMHVDGAYRMFRNQNPEVVTLLAQPNLGWQRASSSDISSRWVDQTPVIRTLFRVAREIRRRVQPPLT